ncbi:phage tail protein [Craterilacuibacter sp. RT1T]|uniref:phage tail protein n=1 Tax=Craterilacuibacter sp. RT1T TaxID=2942211 RepID=UPI0020C136BA|nr:phage tail protein [Craterilacuibacter sp. RT1T]MCL6262180.1 phage tail protein [Craterilacuibacter sp. RT1T]
MNKPTSLRAALSASVPSLKKHPERLHVFIDEGSIASTMGGDSLSFEYRYTCNIIVTDYAGHSDALIVPVLAWIRSNQPELLLNRERMVDGFRFEADILNNASCDISIKLTLTERVGVKESGGKVEATHYGEPAIDPHAGVEWDLFIQGKPAAEWEGVISGNA